MLKVLCGGTDSFVDFGKIRYLCRQLCDIRLSYRHNSKGEEYTYYRLRDSYRDAFGITIHEDLINIGSRDDFTLEEMQLVASLLTEKANGKSPSMFSTDGFPEKVVMLADDLYAKLVAQNRIDLPGSVGMSERSKEELRKKQELRFIANVSTMRHTDVREIGAEHLCYETMRKLKIDNALLSLGFSQDNMALAMTQIAIRAIHPASELATSRWIQENSDICRLTGFDISKVTKDALYHELHRPEKTRL